MVRNFIKSKLTNYLSAVLIGLAGCGVSSNIFRNTEELESLKYDKLMIVEDGVLIKTLCRKRGRGAGAKLDVSSRDKISRIDGIIIDGKNYNIEIWREKESAFGEYCVWKSGDGLYVVSEKNEKGFRDVYKLVDINGRGDQQRDLAMLIDKIIEEIKRRSRLEERSYEFFGR